MARRNLQRERQQRGQDFQDEIRRSWRKLPNVWRFRLPDGGGGNRPGDELILLEEINVLAEHKRTEGDDFQLAFLRPSQLKGLVDFDRVISRNYGLVFVSFLDEARGQDIAYCFRLARALQYMKTRGRQYIHLEEFESGAFPAIALPLLPNEKERTYDLKGVNECYKSL